MGNFSNFVSTLLLGFFGFIKSSGLEVYLDKFLKPSPYFFVVLFLLIVIFIYGMNAGRGRMILLLVSLYIAMPLVGSFPFKKQFFADLTVEQIFFAEIILFLVAIFVSLYLISRSPLRTLIIRERDKTPWLQIFFLSLFILGIFVSFVTNSLPANYTDRLDHPIFKYFGTQNARFWWSFLALVFVALLKRERLPPK